jgi:hypothetical protein
MSTQTIVVVAVVSLCFVVSIISVIIYYMNSGKDTQISTQMSSLPKARYIKIQRTDNKNEAINLLEIEVYDQNNQKITTNITPSLNPQYENPNQFGPQFLIDSLAQNNISRLPHTANSPNAYMQLDLNSDKEISKIIVKNRLDCCKERILGCSLFLINSTNSEIYKKPFSDVQDIYEFKF